MRKVLIIDPREITREGIHNLFCRAERNIVFLRMEAAEQLTLNGDTNMQLVVLHVASRPLASRWARGELSILAATNVPIIILADSANYSEVIEALDLGVRGYILTNSPPKVAACAMKLVMAGGVFVPAETIINKIAACSNDDRSSETNCYEHKAKNPAESIAFLTSRQKAILGHIYEGKRNKEIAWILGLREATVKVHVGRILKKLKATNRTQACANAIKLSISSQRH